MQQFFKCNLFTDSSKDYKMILSGLDELPKVPFIEPEKLKILIIAKPFDIEIDNGLSKVIDFLDSYNLSYFQLSAVEDEDRETLLLKSINRVITLGGDGTILYAVKMYYNQRMPPVISFAMGSMSYM